MAGQVSQQESRPGIKLGGVPHLTHHVPRGKADSSVPLPVSLFFFPSVVRTLVQLSLSLASSHLGSQKVSEDDLVPSAPIPKS